MLRRRRFARPRRMTEKQIERRLQEDRAGYYSMNLAYPAEFYFEHGWEPEIDLENALEEHYHPDMVFLSGSGSDGKMRDLGIEIKGYAKELERNPKQFLKGVANLSRRALSKAFPGLQPRDIEIQVTHWEWDEELGDTDATKRFSL